MKASNHDIIEQFFLRMKPENRERWRSSYVACIRKIEHKEKNAAPEYMLPHFREGLAILEKVIQQTSKPQPPVVATVN